jgi:hypothetical protein
MGGRGRTYEACRRVFDELEERLEAADMKETSTGEVFWHNSTRWERDAMVNAGLLKKGSPHGIWELTDLGRREAEALG